jgi:hypothetical protein
VIRFSAALVAVAIGVLIGGIATSELLLVYIAIVASAVALVALAIGVLLKREELFGEGQGLVPAGAGASPVLPVRIGGSQGAGESQDKVPVGAHAAPLPPVAGAAAGYATPFGGIADLVASANLAPPWETPATHGPRSSSVPDARPAWMPAGKDERGASGVGSAGSRAPSAWQDTSPGRTPGGRDGGRGVPDADAQAATTTPRPPWAVPSSAVSSDVPAVKPGTGSGSAPPSWFDRLGKPAGTDEPATTSTSGPGSGSGWSWPSWDSSAATQAGTTASGTTASGTTASGDEDDDWPTRYSWLDDETDESGEDEGSADEAGEAVAAGEADAELEIESPAPVDTRSDAGTEGIAAPKASAPAASAGAAPDDQPAAATAAAAAMVGASGDAETRDAGAAGPGTPDTGEHADTGEYADADSTALAGAGDSGQLGLTGGPGPEHEVADGAEARSDAEVTSHAGSEPPVADAADAVPGAGLVAVVRGVARYHEQDCVLIRFMPEGDTQRLSIPEAREAGCTPCGACQPE